MPTRYRYTWTNEVNGWNHRLDILPPDADLSDAITALDAGIVMEVGPVEKGSDELPIGIMDAPTMSLTLNYSRCPTALQTNLRNKVDGGDYNAFLFWTDRGTDGGSYTLEFIGTHDNIESTDYDIHESGDYIVTYELIDCLHFVMANTSGATCFTGKSPQATTRYRSLYEVAYNDGTGVISDWGLRSNTPDDNTGYFCLSSWAYCMQQVYEALTLELWSNFCRSTNVGATATTIAADFGLDLKEILTSGVIYYGVDNTTTTRTKGAALDATTAKLITHVYDSDNTLIGGMFSPLDEYGWAQATSVIDLMRDWCESHGVKATYQPAYVADGSGDYIKYTWRISAPGDYDNIPTAAPTIDLDSATEIHSISEGGSAIAKTEVRYDLNSARYQYDITEYVATNSRSRSSRSWNTEPIVHNVMSYKPFVARSGVGAYERGIYQTNIIVDNAEGIACKAHESTRVIKSKEASSYQDTTFTENMPIALGTRDMSVADNKTNNARLAAYVNTAQMACSPAALAEAVLSMFSSPYQTVIEVTYPLTYSANVRPEMFGTKHSLTNGPVDVLTHLIWTRAIITHMSTDFTAGTNTITYLLMDIS